MTLETVITLTYGGAVVVLVVSVVLLVMGIFSHISGAPQRRLAATFDYFTVEVYNRTVYRSWTYLILAAITAAAVTFIHVGYPWATAVALASLGLLLMSFHERSHFSPVFTETSLITLSALVVLLVAIFVVIQHYFMGGLS